MYKGPQLTGTALLSAYPPAVTTDETHTATDADPPVVPLRDARGLRGEPPQDRRRLKDKDCARALGKYGPRRTTSGGVEAVCGALVPAARLDVAALPVSSVCPYPGPRSTIPVLDSAIHYVLSI